MFQIIWSNNAILQQSEILKFWNEHNQSFSYSNKILDEILRFENLLEINPFIGSETAYRNVRRVVVLENFSLYFTIIEKSVHILVAIRDNRRNLDTLEL